MKTTSDRKAGYSIEPIPKMRRFSLDAGYLGRHRHIVHGLIEVDVTAAREHIREHKARTGERLSFTAFIITCLGEALATNRHLHAYRDWRGRLVMFDDISITTMVEVEVGGKKVPMPLIIKEVNRKTYRDIHTEIRSTQASPGETSEANLMRWFLSLPAFVRRLFYWAVMRMPRSFRKYASSVRVTAVGMVGRGGGWGITMPSSTLTVAVGGIAQKPWVVDGKIVIREILDITLSVDHDIVDGAPFARFVSHFRVLLESKHGLSGQ